MEAQWAQLPEAEPTQENAEGNCLRTDCNPRWFIYIQQREFEAISEDWGGNVMMWMKKSSEVEYRDAIQERDIFATRD